MVGSSCDQFVIKIETRYTGPFDEALSQEVSKTHCSALLHPKVEDSISDCIKSM